jgi:hypothetical protein
MNESIVVECNNPDHARRPPSMVAEFSYDPNSGWSVMGAAPPSVKLKSRSFRVSYVLGSGVVNLPRGLRCKLCDQRLPPSIDTTILNNLVRQGVSPISIKDLNTLRSTEL